MSSIMEMQNFINYIREVLDKMFQHGGLIIPHRTLRVESHTGVHTMEVLIADIPYPPPVMHLFHLTHPDIIRVTPEPGHTPPRVIIVGKPHAINMAMTGRLLMTVQSSVTEMIRLQLGTRVPDAARSNAYQVLGLSRQLDIIIEQNHRMHSLIQTLSPPTSPDGPYAYRRLVTRIKRSSSNAPHSDSAVMWSTLPSTSSNILQDGQEQPLIIPNNLPSFDEDSDSDRDSSSVKRRRPSTPVPRPDIA
jgi:hypothetical protein